MFELMINEQVYQFHFGMGFLREINKTVSAPVDGLQGVKKNMGLRYTAAGIIDGDPEALVELLDIANKGQSPRVTRALLDSYIEDENTDVDKLFDTVMGFLKTANATKSTVLPIAEAVEKEKAKK